MQAPAFAARCMKKSPAQTRHSLFASATAAPRSTAASAGFNPAAPLTAAITQSAGRAAASMMALSPAPHSVPRAGKRVLQFAKPRRIGDRGKPRVEFAGQLGQRLHIGVRGQRLDLITVARAAQQIHGAVADRTGGAQHRHGARIGRRAALLLRKGTALITSPNHKTAANAIGAAPQQPENRRHNDGGDKAIQPIQQPAMAGNDLARILDAETPLYRGFKQIAELRNDRKNRAKQQQRRGFSETERRKAARLSQGSRKTANGAGPGLLRADARPEFRPADAAAGKIAADIGHPDHQQHKDERNKAA